MRKLFELPDETIGIISSLVVNHCLRRCWRYGLSAYHTLDKTTLLLSHPLRPRGHQRFQCPFLPAPYLSITTYYRHTLWAIFVGACWLQENEADNPARLWNSAILPCGSTSGRFRLRERLG